MKIVAVFLIVLANVCFYVRRLILARRGYKIPWLVVWRDCSMFVKVIESTPPSAKKKFFIALNFAPMTLFITALFVVAIQLTLEAKF